MSSADIKSAKEEVSEKVEEVKEDAKAEYAKSKEIRIKDIQKHPTFRYHQKRLEERLD